MLKRTHTCGDLTAADVGKTVIVNGWVNAWRDFGGLVFIDVRDRYGLTQCVFEPEVGAELQAAARELRNEYVVGIRGVVARRLPGKENPNLKTGAIEVRADALEVFNATPTPPFDIQGAEANEELRLKFRYLDLRRPAMQEVFIVRHRMSQLMRKVMSEQNFLELETPILGRSTPEGARDFLVPSRVHTGHFYALPQSPQLYKQVLMVAGFDRYFQIARCFRDEDLRGHHQRRLEADLGEQRQQRRRHHAPEQLQRPPEFQRRHRHHRAGQQLRLRQLHPGGQLHGRLVPGR